MATTLVVKRNQGRVASNPGLALSSPHENVKFALSLEGQASPSFPSLFPTRRIQHRPRSPGGLSRPSRWDR